MAVLLDTNILIDALRQNPEALAYLRSLAIADEDLYASEITKAEILAGARKGEEEAMERLFRLFLWLGVDDTIARQAGAFANEYRDKYRSISLEDYLIAASATVTDLSLATLNIRDFPMFARLKPPY